MKIRLYALILFLLCILFSGCQDQSDVIKTTKGIQLILRGDSTGKIINTNTFTVMIRCVYQHRGEKTLWLEEFQPQSSKELGRVTSSRGFYIYRDSNLIGFLRGK